MQLVPEVDDELLDVLLLDLLQSVHLHLQGPDGGPPVALREDIELSKETEKI